MLKFWTRHQRGAGVARTQVKVGLNRFALGALEEASRSGAVNRADVMNRALLVYAALQRVAPSDDSGVRVVCNDEELWIGFI